MLGDFNRGITEMRRNKCQVTRLVAVRRGCKRYHVLGGGRREGEQAKTPEVKMRGWSRASSQKF